MTPEIQQSLKDILERIHSNTVYACDRAKAFELVLKKHPDLWAEYQDALRFVQEQAVHRDFDSLLDKIG